MQRKGKLRAAGIKVANALEMDLFITAKRQRTDVMHFTFYNCVRGGSRMGSSLWRCSRWAERVAHSTARSAANIQ